MTVAEMIYILRANDYDLKTLPEYGNIKECVLAALMKSKISFINQLDYISQDLKQDEDVLALLLEEAIFEVEKTTNYEECSIEECIAKVEDILNIDFKRVKEKIAGIWIYRGYPILTKSELAKIKQEEIRKREFEKEAIDKPQEEVEDKPQKGVGDRPQEDEEDKYQEDELTDKDWEEYSRYINIFGLNVIPKIEIKGNIRQLDFVDELIELVRRKENLKQRLSDNGSDIAIEVELRKIENRLMNIYGKAKLWNLTASSSLRKSVVSAVEIGDDIIPGKDGMPLMEINIEDIQQVIGDRCYGPVVEIFKTLVVEDEKEKFNGK